MYVRLCSVSDVSLPSHVGLVSPLQEGRQGLLRVQGGTVRKDRDGVGDESIDFADVLIEGGADVDEAERSWGGKEERQQCLFPLFFQSC